MHKRKFLAAYAVCGRVNQSARWSRVSRTCHWVWMQQDERYRAAFEDAQRQATRMMVDEATRRAVEGTRKAVYFEGRVVGYENVYSDRLLERLLEAYEPEMFSRKAKVDVSITDESGIRAALEAGRARAEAGRVVDVTAELVEQPAIETARQVNPATAAELSRRQQRKANADRIEAIRAQIAKLQEEKELDAEEGEDPGTEP